jgi:hypothetical protein
MNAFWLIIPASESSYELCWTRRLTCVISMFIQQYQGFGKSIQTFEQGRGYYVQKEGVDG